MARPTHALVITCVAIVLSSTSAGAQSVSTCDSGGTGYRFKVAYEDNRVWLVTRPSIPNRITDRDRVEVCVQHFNYLRYTLKFNIEEQRAESYSYLTKLWGSILSPTLGDILFDAQTRDRRGNELTRKLQKLYSLSRDLDGAVASATAKYTATGLTTTEASALAKLRGNEADTPPGGIVSMRTVTAEAFNEVERRILSSAEAFEAIYSTHQAMYKAVVDHYHVVDERAQIFLALSAKTIGVEIKRVGKREAGTRVTFTLTAADGSGATTAVNEVSYFVQSTMPLVAHGGIAFSGLNDVTFTKVRRSATFGEEELFQRTTNEDESTAYTLFLGWQFYGSGNDVETDQRKSKVGAAFSLGTDVRQPGKRIFLGPSLLWLNRLVLSAGIVLGKESEGENDAFEPNVFRIIREKPKSSYFFSLSTKVF